MNLIQNKASKTVIRCLSLRKVMIKVRYKNYELNDVCIMIVSSNNDSKKSPKMNPDDVRSTHEKNTAASKSLITNNQNATISKQNEYNIDIKTHLKYNIADDSACGSALATNLNMRQKLEISLNNLESGNIFNYSNLIVRDNKSKNGSCKY